MRIRIQNTGVNRRFSDIGTVFREAGGMASNAKRALSASIGSLVFVKLKIKI
jgi:hypothetical protein